MASAFASYEELPVRESTFTAWKLTCPDAYDMAQAGFIYKGPGDEVECYACGVVVGDWKEDQDPMLRHMQAAESCPVIEHEPNDDDQSSVVESHVTQTTISLGQASRDSGMEGGRRMAPHANTLAGSGTAITLRDNPMPVRHTRYTPAPVRYRKIEERIKSFQDVAWDPSLEATPDKLAKAGFYFVGPGDRVKCGYCGGKLKKWRPKDVAVEEHVRHFPDCSFVKNVEEQTAVLAKKIRSKKKTDNCVSSEELKAQYDMQRTRTKRMSKVELAKRTLKKMKYSNNEIHRAQRQLRDKEMALSLENFFKEIQSVSKEIFFRSTSAEVADAEEEEDDEMLSDLEEEEDKPVIVESTDETVIRLEQELRAVNLEREELMRQTTCKVCLANKIDTLFLTCRHFVTCKDCAERVRDCPLCRQVILGTVDVFMA